MDYDQPYKIEDISGDFVLVLSTSFDTLDYLRMLEQSLREKSFSGQVLVDLLLCNGNADNRFVQWPFEQGKLKRNSLKVVDIEEIDATVLALSEQFYRDNPFLLERNYILLEEEKQAVLAENRELAYQ